MAQAIAFVHENKIAHRDIKPDNILVKAPEIALKLIDFNIAHDLTVSPEIKGVCGLRAWSAPETRKFQSYDERCDLWSVGCVLLYACTGSAPFTTDDSIDRTETLIAEATERFGESPDREQLADLLSKLLERNPEARINSKQMLEHAFLA